MFWVLRRLQDRSMDRKRQVARLKPILRSKVFLQESNYKREFFNHWKSRADLQQMNQIQHIMECISQFNDNVLNQGQADSLKEGLPVFQNLVQDLLIQCLNLKENEMQLDILFVN